MGLSFRIQEKWLGRALLITIVGLLMLSIYLLKLSNEWNAKFFNALQEKDSVAFWHQMRNLGFLVFFIAAVSAHRTWLRQLFVIRWRRWLTNKYMTEWLSDRRFYKMELLNIKVDNVEQRIEQDIQSFAETTAELTLGFLSNVISFATFTSVLWNISGVYIVPVLGGITIPGYMMWLAVVYGVLASWLTYLVASPLVQANFDLRRSDADFRYKLIQIHENAEAIAFSNGELREHQSLSGRFDRIYEAWWRLMLYTRRLTWLNSIFSQVPQVLPFFIASPRYFAGQIGLGVLVQTGSAFSHVQEGFLWFVNSYASLADWKAVVNRLTTLSEALERTYLGTEQELHGLAVKTGHQPDVEVADLKALLPDGRLLFQDSNFRIQPSQNTILQGPAGSGKSTLLRIMAGLWPSCTGKLRIPARARVLFLSEDPYIPVSSLREAVCYPEDCDAYHEYDLRQALLTCELGSLVEQMDDTKNWRLVLSKGEKQLISFARAILTKPDWLILDDTGSALDTATEALLYERLRGCLPMTTIICVSHKPVTSHFFEHRLRIDPSCHQVFDEEIETSYA